MWMIMECKKMRAALLIFKDSQEDQQDVSKAKYHAVRRGINLNYSFFTHLFKHWKKVQ